MLGCFLDCLNGVDPTHLIFNIFPNPLAFFAPRLTLTGRVFSIAIPLSDVHEIPLTGSGVHDLLFACLKIPFDVRRSE